MRKWTVIVCAACGCAEFREHKMWYVGRNRLGMKREYEMRRLFCAQCGAVHTHGERREAPSWPLREGVGGLYEAATHEAIVS